jgi:hypothetical protein
MYADEPENFLLSNEVAKAFQWGRFPRGADMVDLVRRDAQIRA